MLWNAGSFVLGLLLGFLLTRQYYIARAKRRRKKVSPEPPKRSAGGSAKTKELGVQSKEKELSRGERKALGSEETPKPNPSKPREITQQTIQTDSDVSDKAPVSHPPAGKDTAANAKRKQMEELYRSFQAVGTLELSFQYSFPGNHLFQKGSGYLYNSQREVLPEKNVFSQTDSAKGYAMCGLFWVYDVIYEGKRYTFDQIMEDVLGSDYMRIVAVLRYARIQETVSPERYYLEKRGILEIAKYAETE